MALILQNLFGIPLPIAESSITQVCEGEKKEELVEEMIHYA